jgi:hypothetical protein
MNMDPQACLNEIFRLLLSAEEDAAEEARYSLLDLVEWHERGGFAPDVKVALDEILRRRRDMIEGVIR